MLKMAYELRISDWSSDLCSACLKGVPWWRDGQSRSGFKRKGLCHGLLLWGRPRKLHGPATDDSFSSRGWRPQLCGFALRVVGHSSQCGSRSEGAKGIKSQDRGRSDVERAIKDSGCTVMDRLDGSSFSA